MKQTRNIEELGYSVCPYCEQPVDRESGDFLYGDLYHWKRGCLQKVVLDQISEIMEDVQTLEQATQLLMQLFQLEEEYAGPEEALEIFKTAKLQREKETLS